jgi:hypothetical protein
MLWALLLLAAAPPAPSVKPAPARPAAVLTIPDPRATLPRLGAALSWLALAQPELSPARMKNRLATLGFALDPFDPASLERAGVDTKKPISLWLGFRDPALVIELDIGDPAAAQRFLEDESVRRPMGWLPGKQGLIAGDSARSAVALIREKQRWLIQIGAGVSQDTWWKSTRTASSAGGAVSASAADPRLSPIESARRGVKPKKPPRAALAEKTPADLWLHADVDDPNDVIERVELASWLRPDSTLVRAQLSFSTVAAALAPDFDAKSGPKRLVGAGGELSPAVEVLVGVPPAGLRELAERLHVGAPIAAALSGHLQVVLTEAGELVGAASFRPKLSAEQAEKIARAVELERPALHAASVEGGPTGRMLIAASGALHPDKLELARTAAAESKPLPPPVQLSLRPRVLFDALRARSNGRDHLGPSSLELMFVRMVLKPLFDATERASASVRLVPGGLDATAEIVRSEAARRE